MKVLMVEPGKAPYETEIEGGLESLQKAVGGSIQAVYPYDDPDLLIRTSGEERISNFLLWQLAYSEMVFTDTFWPDYSPADLAEDISKFQQRNRRFGGLNEEDKK